MRPIDVLIVGAGPAGLAAAIRAKKEFQRLHQDASVVVIDKASKLGRHSLSGAAIETECLDLLLPGWQEMPGAGACSMTPVVKDEMYFLTATKAFQIPPLLVPRGMRHRGDVLVSLSSLVDMLGRRAADLGVEVYSGFAARELLWDEARVVGVKLTDAGRDKQGNPKANFLAGESVYAKVTVLADGARGVLSREYIKKMGGGRNPQVYSIGVKQVLHVGENNPVGAGRVIHTLGFPNRMDVFGGGFMYGLDKEHIALGLILGLDWKYTDLDPQAELEYFKTHPWIRSFIQGTRPVAGGAKTIPEGGWFALPKLWSEGVLLVGDAAGFVNMEKIKGIHCAILSGVAAADAVVAGSLAEYPVNLEARGVGAEMRGARNFRACFQWGVLAGAPLSQIQRFLPLRIPMGYDHERTRPGAQLKRTLKPVFDRAALAALSGALHREDEPSHIVIPDPALCDQCQRDFKSPCTAFCPTEVYRRREDGIALSPSNCVHCGTCVVKCPLCNIVWSLPEGGEGPRYKRM